jgi:hypothetical protein
MSYFLKYENLTKANFPLNEDSWDILGAGPDHRTHWNIGTP